MSEMLTQSIMVKLLSASEQVRDVSGWTCTRAALPDSLVRFLDKVAHAMSLLDTTDAHREPTKLLGLLQQDPLLHQRKQGRRGRQRDATCRINTPADITERTIEVGGKRLLSQRAKTDCLKGEHSSNNEEISNTQVHKAKAEKQKVKLEKDHAEASKELTVTLQDLCDSRKVQDRVLPRG
ncbi:hypothetical protein ACHAPU_008065 [Fusarium lateritium]